MFRTETKWIWLAIALTLLGMSVSAVLMQHHVAIKVGSDPVLAAICDAGESASCDEVIGSKWGMLFNLPTAMWGFFFYAGLFAWYMIIGIPTGRARWYNSLPVMALFGGVGWCAFLAFDMYVRLEHWCPLCAVTHFNTLILFVVSLFLWLRRKPRAAIDNNGKIVHTPEMTYEPTSRAVVGFVLLTAAMSFGAWCDYNRQVNTKIAMVYKEQYDERQAALDQYHSRWQEYHIEALTKYKSYLSQKQIEIPIDSDDPIRGNPDAPNTIVVFSDVLCPYCAAFEAMYNKEFDQFGDEVRMVFKHFPMNKDCNPLIKSTLHKGACATAWTVEATRLMGGDELYWKMLDGLMGRQKDFLKSAQGTVNEIADELGMDRTELFRHIRSAKSHERVDRNIAQAGELGVSGTPTIFLNGRKVHLYLDKQFWRFAIRDARNLSPEDLEFLNESSNSDQPAATQPTATQPTATQPATTQPATTR